MDKIGVNFMLSANAAGMAAGMKQASAQLDEVAKSAQATSGEYRKAARITAELQTPTEKYAKEVATLDSYLLRGLLTQEIYNRALERSKQELEGASNAAKSFSSATQEAAKSTSTAVQEVEESSNSLVDFGKTIVATAAKWKIFTLGIRAFPSIAAATASYSTGLLKAAGITRTLLTAAKVAGVGVALFGGSLGLLSSVALGLTNPLLGAVLLTYNLVRSFFAAKEAAFATAKAVGEMSAEAQKLGASLQDVQIGRLLEAGVAKEDILQLGAAISAIDLQQFDNLAFAVEEVDAANKRSAVSFDTFARVLATPFVGAFAAITSGIATLTNGMTDLMSGINAILLPIAQALAPIVTLFGVIIEIILKTIGVIGSIVGVVLRVAGVILQAFLAPIINGLTNFANAIREGVVYAFDLIAMQLAWLQKKIDGVVNFLATLPIIGGVFATDVGSAPVAVDNSAAMADQAKAAEEASKLAEAAMKEEADAVESINKAIERQHALLSKAIDSSAQFGQAGFDAALEYQEALKELDRQLEAGILNETSYAQAASAAADEFDKQTKAIQARNKAAADLIAEDAKAEQDNQNATTKQTDAFFKATEDIEKFGAAGADAAAQYQSGLMDLNEQLRSGMINQETYNRKVDELNGRFEKQKVHLKEVEDLEKKAAEAEQFRMDNIEALGRKSGNALQANDVRSSEGIAQVIALTVGREDPAIEENRKQVRKLEEIRQELKNLNLAGVDILGAAA